MRRSLLLIAAAFAAGLGLGYLLRPSRAVERRARGATAATETPGLPAVATAPASGEPSLPGLIPELPKGEGRIRGHVRDDGGSPLEGALVVADPIAAGTQTKWRKGAAGPVDRDLEEWTREWVSNERWRREARRTARTGADGAYEITGLGPLKWQLQAYKEGFQLQPTGDVYRVEPGATVDFAGGAIVRVDVDVRMPDGSQPASANIEAVVRTGNSTSSTSEAWLPVEPWIELSPKTYELTATTDAARSQPQTVTVEQGRALNLAFQLEDRPGLRVKVIPPEEFPALRAEVVAMRFTGAKPPDLARLRNEGQRGFIRRREDQVTWQGLEPGSYLIAAAYTNDSPFVVSKVVQIATGIAEHDLRLPPVDPKDFLVVRVRDPDGNSPADVQFGLTYQSAHRNSSKGGVNAIARADGAYLVHRQPREEEESDGRYSIAAETSIGRVEQVYDPSDTREIVLRFEAPAFIDVTIAGYEGSPHAGYLEIALYVRDATGRSRRVNGNRPGPRGKCRLGPAQPGTYDLVLCATPESWRISALPVDLRSGEQAAAMDVPALHTLTVRWPGKGTRILSIRRKDVPGAWVRREVTEESTTIERMPAGVFEMTAYGASASSEPVDVEIPRQAEITIK